MVLTLYNTLKKQKEEFVPLCALVAGLYHCGPTVYNFVHIGNLRAYVFADVLRRTLEYGGYLVKQVINITDIGHLTSDADDGEDKMVKALRREGKPLTLAAMKEVAEKYERAFREDLQALNIKTDGTQFPRASEHIAEDIEIIKKLEEKGSAYRTSDGIYFNTSTFPEYGTRGGFALGALKAGARVAVHTEKKNPRDFALWKFASGDIGFPSPWGVGFPGWHIECSAMSRKYLGQPFDIHTGGIDHIPVHHQNEIAQSEATYGGPLARYWLHSEFVNVGGGSNPAAQGSGGVKKMAKSEENFLTLRTLAEKGIHPLAYRYLLLQTHYRSPLAFSWAALAAAHAGYVNLLASFARLADESGSPEKITATEDDLDTPALAAHLSGWLKTKNKKAILDADRILGLDIENQARALQKETADVPEEIKKILAAREDARRAGDFARADALRADIQNAGFEVLDTDEGPVVRKSVVHIPS